MCIRSTGKKRRGWLGEMKCGEKEGTDNNFRVGEGGGFFCEQIPYHTDKISC